MAGEVVPLRTPQSDDTIRPIPSFEFERDPPPIEWMVEGCFPRGTVAMLSGDGAIGKSTIAMQLCAAACLGQDWLGLKTTAGRALFLSCEDDSPVLQRRQRNIETYLGCAYADFEGGLHLVDRVGQENALAVLDRQAWRMKPTDLFVKLGLHCRRHGINYVVVDTATKTFMGNQNDERLVDDYLNIMRRLALAIDGVVLLNKHPSAAGRVNGSGESGSVAWNNGVRSRLYMREEGDGLILSGMKSNYGRKLDKIYLRWEKGVFVPVEGQETHESAPVLSGADLRYRLIQGVARAISAGARIYADEQHRQSVAQRARHAHDPVLSRVPLAKLYDAQAEMIRSGELAVVDVKGACLVRPRNGPCYADEKQWEIKFA